MIPLAQAWLDVNTRSKTRYDAELQRHLELPTTYNKYTTPHVLNRLAERIVFTDDIPSILHEMEANKQLTYTGILRTVKLPYDCFWIEYKAETNDEPPDNAVYFGALVRKIANDAVRMHVVCGICSPKTKKKLLAGIVYVIEFPRWPPAYDVDGMGRVFGFNLVYSFNKSKITSANGIDYSAAYDISWILTEMIFGIFLVTQPKVYKDEVCKPSEKLQRARARSGKQPMLEYRRINVHIMRKHKHYNRPDGGLQQAFRSSTRDETIDDVQHRRYHKVMGHFRHYVNTDNPRTIWIEPHYRGDPSLGVTFTERDVSR